MAAARRKSAKKERKPTESMASADRKSISPGGGAFSRLGIGRADGPGGVQITVGVGKSQYGQKSGEGLVARSPGAALKQMNAACRRPGYLWMVGSGGTVLVLASFFAPLPAWGHVLLTGLLAGLTAAAFQHARAADAGRRRFHLEYHLDSDARERWTLLNHALAALTRTERIWQIRARGRAQGWKRDTGASVLVTRARATLRREIPTSLTSSITPYCLHIGPQRWLFLPDRLYVLQNGGYEAVEYTRLQVTGQTTRFIEEEQVPRDAQMVGRPQGVSITEYGVLEIGAPSGLRATLHISSVGAADQFTALFGSFQSYCQSDGPMPPPSAPSEGCYGRLGLTPSCTKAEATRQFRRLVLAHHPDRVCGGGPDLQERANMEMQEIVLAYKDLKRLHGW